MALIIRMRQQGRNNNQTFRVVVTDSRSPRDGKYIEAIGWYNPAAPRDELLMNIKPDRVAFWLAQGAEISDRVKSLVERAAPEVIRQYAKKNEARRIKLTAKRRANRKAKAKAVKPAAAKAKKANGK